MMMYLLNKIKTFLVTLRFSILFIFIGLFITSTLLIITISSISVRHTISLAAKELMQYASMDVFEALQLGMTPAAIRGDLSADLIKQKVLTVPDIWTNLIPYTFSMLQKMPLLISAYWGDVHGNMIFSKKNKDGTITTIAINRQSRPATERVIYRNKSGGIIKQDLSRELNFDPRVRRWYIDASVQKKALWTDLYLFEKLDKDDLGITRATPVYENGQLLGVFGVDIDLNYISNFLSKQAITANGISFLITKEDNLLAYPGNKKPFTNLTHPKNQLMNLSLPSLKIIKETFHYYKNSTLGKSIFFYTVDKKSYLVSYQPIPQMASYGWFIGVIVPVEDFSAGLLKANIIGFGLSLLILVLGVIIVSGLITRIVKPIKLLAVETENIKNFDLDIEVDIKSRIKEILYLKDAIDNMKLGLKLFQRYIPKTLVRQLIASGEELRIGGVRKELAVFFSDIEHFTTAAEKSDPNLIIAQLSEYFEALSVIISKEKGTIDKYIGDSIMAFWGAPLIDTKSCYHAAKAALACQLRLNELNARWKANGQPVFITRIGLHSGSAIVGNFGSSERLNYTALGDNINIASRLQEINKHYKTKIIVSDVVYAKIRDKFVLRLIDSVALEGRKNKTDLYELLGDNLTVLPFDLNAYTPLFEKGFAAYQQQQWSAARSFFEACLTVYPADTITPVFIDFCTKNLTIHGGEDPI